MIYDPNNELTEEQLTQLSEDEFFEYLDTKAEYLKGYSRPLPGHLLKKYAYIDAAVRGDKVTDEQHENLQKMAKEYKDEAVKRIVDKINKDGFQ